MAFNYAPIPQACSDLIRVSRRIKLMPAAIPHGSITTADASLIDAEKLFRQPLDVQLACLTFHWLIAETNGPTFAMSAWRLELCAGLPPHQYAPTGPKR
jgi:hypothetical protein